MTGSWADEEGTVTAEFAIVLPAVFVLVAACIGAMGVASQAVRLSDAASVVARQAGRGDGGRIESTLATLAPGATVSIERGDLVCVALELSARLGPFDSVVPLTARSCAPSDGG